MRDDTKFATKEVATTKKKKKWKEIMRNPTACAMGLTQLCPLADNHSLIYYTAQDECKKCT